MPSQTFFNLPEDKRERIINAAVDEFSKYSFNNASIARIIEGAGIPRGSFYQYFDDIKDVYKYMLQISGDKKLQYLYGLLGKLDELSIFQILRELYAGGLRFAEEHPRLAAIGNNLLKESQELKEEIFGDMEHKSSQFYEGLLIKAIQKGELSSALDIKVGAFIFNSLSTAITDYFLSQSEEKDVLTDSEGFLKTVDSMLYIIENGMKNLERK